METLAERVEPGAGASEAGVKPAWHAPLSTFDAIARGVRNRCPNCGEARLFPRFLKPVDHCPVCHKDWAPHRADDFPAYLSIFITGHLMAPVIILLAGSEAMPIWAIVVIIVALVLALSIALLQPCKGAVMAMLWRFGVNGKQEELSDETTGEGGHGREN